MKHLALVGILLVRKIFTKCFHIDIDKRRVEETIGLEMK